MAGKALKVGVPIAALALVGGLWSLGDDDYQATVTLDSATNVVEGGPVLVNGFEAGKVTGIEVVDGRAKVSFALDPEHAPLHAGAQIDVDWKAALSERVLSITDGAEKNAEVPDGGTVPGRQPKPTELDQVLNALDAPTRKTLQSLTKRLSTTLDGNEKDLAKTVGGAGPTLEALGEILRALGTDGPAIRHLIQRVNTTLDVVADRDGEVAQIVTQLATLSDRLAERRGEVRETLRALPATLDQARSTLDLVPATTDEAVPLLDDLAPATAKLKPVAKNLAPVLRDLRPLTADLKPALASLDTLLQITPGLVGVTNQTLPSLTTAVKNLREPIEFARPYTPEIVAYPSLWASAFANYDSYGNYARLSLGASATSLNENPGIVPPGITYDPYPAPGAIVDQPWTDAAGDEMR
ncbi:MlaD family protein [Nocardioides dubius]|uniref:Mce/MlaD domain-containing protein n=1 Tax=Nocardioides dubius TaxID=317019 RepID=A0ABN1U0I5_9ACTN